MYFNNLAGGGNLTYYSTGTGYILGNTSMTGTITDGNYNMSFGTGGAGGTFSGGPTPIADNGGVSFYSTTNTTYSGSISGGGWVVKQGTNTLTMTGTNSFTGGTYIRGGTLLLDFSAATAPAANILTSGSALNMDQGPGSTLIVKGRPSGTSSQTMGNLAIGVPGAIILNPNGGGGTTLTVGNTWTRSNNATLWIDLSAGNVSSPANLVSNPRKCRQRHHSLGQREGRHGVRLRQHLQRHDRALHGRHQPAARLRRHQHGELQPGRQQRRGGQPDGHVRRDGQFAVDRPHGRRPGPHRQFRPDLGLHGRGHRLRRHSAGLHDQRPRPVGRSAAALTILTNGSNALTIGAPISSGAGSLSVGGSGTVILTAASSYTGATAIGRSATLQLGNGTSDGSLTTSSSIIVGGTLAFNILGNQTYASNVLSGSGSLTKTGVGTLAVGNEASYYGAITVNGGQLQVNGTNNGSSAGIYNASSLTINNGGNIYSNGASNGLGLGGSMPVTVNAGGVLSSNSAYTETISGLLTLAGGTLTASSGASGDGSTFGVWNIGNVIAGGVATTSVIRRRTCKPMAPSR